MLKSIYITSNQCPGDICMLTAAVRDLKKAMPQLRINVSTPADYLWENNPHLDRSVTRLNADKVVEAHYDLIHKSNTHPYHFIHGYRIYLAQLLGYPIGQGSSRVDIHLTDSEKRCYPYKGHKRYWILNAGFKSDFTNKGWDIERYKKVVELLKDEVVFVQIGEKNRHHTHQHIPGAVDMRGKTPGREFLKLMYHAAGVLTGVSYPMHLSTMDTDPTVCRKWRPCVTLVGGREPIQWVQQPNMQALHCCTMLDCCENGGCWKSRVVPLKDGSDKDKSLCLHPVKTQSGQVIPLCMHMISVEDVVNSIRKIERSSGVINGVRM